MRSRTGAAVLAIAAAVAIAVLAREANAHWLGTLALALVTGRLVASTDRGILETHRLATLAERDQEARIRPAVMLWHDTEWFAPGHVGSRVNILPFVNAGGGPALNVEVQVYWPSDNCALATTSIGAGERTRLFARTQIGGFEKTWGQATYSDLLGRRWETRFMIETGPDGQPQFQLRAYGLAELLPQQAAPAGWDYGPNNLPRIFLPPATADG